MATRFRKIAEDGIDPTRVTLRLIAGADGAILGRVSTLAYGETGAIEMMTTESVDPPIGTALELAGKLAAFKEHTVDVVDADDLWRPEWGPIEQD